MGDYASKGVAGSGLGLGIAGTALGVLNANGGNGLLGGLFGGNQANLVSSLQAENATLKGQKYADQIGKEVYAQSLADNRMLRDEAFKYVKPIADEVANNRVEVARLQEQVKCNAEKQELREQIVIGKINEVALATNGKFAALDNTISCLTSRVDGITKEVVPLCAVCPQPMPRFNSWEEPKDEAPACCGK